MDLPPAAAALADAHRRVQIWLGARGVDEARSAEAMLEVDEALGAELERADPGTPFGIHLEVAHDGDELRVAVARGTVRTA
jgi:hypothetical protein